jgi:hypothetical protein
MIRAAMKKAAEISPCKLYRWTLSREWSDAPKACWVMCNPSWADHEDDDPTIRRVIHFTKEWGFGGFTVVNLYPFRSPSPTECRAWAAWEGRGPDWSARDALQRNEALVAGLSKQAGIVVAAWGAVAWDGDHVERIVECITSGAEPFPDIYCLGVTASGAPKHPMARGTHRIPDTQQPVLWRKR